MDNYRMPQGTLFDLDRQLHAKNGEIEDFISEAFSKKSKKSRSKRGTGSKPKETSKQAKAKEPANSTKKTEPTKKEPEVTKTTQPEAVDRAQQPKDALQSSPKALLTQMEDLKTMTKNLKSSINHTKAPQELLEMWFNNKKFDTIGKLDTIIRSINRIISNHR